MSRGFSLVEVLCVMAIICVLMSLMFPAFTGAKDAAGLTVCASNLRQIRMAGQMYREDYGEYPPNSLRAEPFFTNYMGGTSLLCPVGTARGVRPPFHYYTMWSAEPQHVNDLADCRAKRGEDIPIAFDKQHAIARSIDDLDKFELIIREGGALDRVVLLRSRPAICFFDHLNF